MSVILKTTNVLEGLWLAITMLAVPKKPTPYEQEERMGGGKGGGEGGRGGKEESGRERGKGIKEEVETDTQPDKTLILRNAVQQLTPIPTD